MKITKSQLKRIIKEELQAVLKEVGAPGHMPSIDEIKDRLAHDKVLYYHVKGQIDHYDKNKKELSHAEFVEILEGPLDPVVKEAIKYVLLHKKEQHVEIWRSVGEDIYEFAVEGMIEWAKGQIELGPIEKRQPRRDPQYPPHPYDEPTTYGSE